MKKILKIFIILAILLFLYIFICAYNYVLAVSNDLGNNVFRLHIIANSDSEEDQNLKYAVRDGLLEYMNEICIGCTDKEEVIKVVEENLSNFKEIAEQIVKENGYSYNVNIEIGNFEFPTKTYGDIIFPAGYYDALKVEIGEAVGQNWWCVMFPPLCFIDTSTGIISEDSKEVLEENLFNETYSIISDTEDSDITLKFKIIELFEQTGIITAKNN